MSNAPDIPTERFSALTRLDHNRAISQLAAKLGVPVTEIKKMTIWGNHSATQYPDLFHAEVAGKNAAEAVGDQDWLAGTLHPDRRQARRGHHRGPRRVLGRVGCVRDHRPRARLGAGHRRRRLGVDGRPLRRLLRRQEGIISSFPVTRQGRRLEIVQGLDIDDFSRGKIDASVAELAEERDAVKGLGLI